MLLVVSKRKKKEARSNSEGSSDDNHLSKDRIQGHFARKLFSVMVFMLGQIRTIRVRNYMYYPSCRSGNKYRYKRKIDACYSFCYFTSVYIIFAFLMPMMPFFIIFISGFQLTQKERKTG